jgi:hypothetical protein
MEQKMEFSLDALSLDRFKDLAANKLITKK